MAFKMVVILMMLVSWSTLLYADSTGCGEYTGNVPESDYQALIPEIQKRCKRTFSKDDITCFKANSDGYCVVLTIRGADGRNTICTVKWGIGSNSGTASICTTNGAAVAGGGSGNVRTRVRAGSTIGPGNARSGDEIRNNVRRKISESFAKHGLPFHTHGSPFGK